jgi:hypothetical protein
MCVANSSKALTLVSELRRGQLTVGSLKQIAFMLVI